MDRSTVENGDKYLHTSKIIDLQFSYEGLSAEGVTQHEQYVENTITVANHWLGSSGDYFLFAANTIATYLAFTLKYYDTYADLLGNYQITFNDIDEELSDDVSVEEH